ncbi:MAG: hypothetical protein B9S34_16035 [Opitutia bacterium Tous-C1TDCM]|nr:MAG: hypothetical protein B9S34_16035 [Opitutae bacterium Tous-C1TDCM]
MSPRFLLAACLLFGGTAPARAERDPEAGLPFVTAFAPRDYRGHQQVLAVAEDAAGRLYFGNLDKVLVYDGARWTHLPVPGATFIRGLVVDADDTLWIGGVDELGYARTGPDGARTFVSLRSHLPVGAHSFGTVWKIVPTPAGPLFQSASHLLLWDGRAFRILALPESPRWRLAEVAGESWLTDPAHGWFRVRTDGATPQLAPLPRPAACAGERITGAAPAGPGAIVATDRQGLWRWDGTAFAPFVTDIDAELRTGEIYHLCGLADGRLAVASIQTGLRLLDASGRALAHLAETTGLPDNTAIVAFAPRDPGVLWVGLGRGAARIDVRPWLTWFHPANGAPRSKLFAPVRHGGELLVPAAAGGLLRLAPGSGGRPANLVRDPALAGHVNGLAVAAGRLIVSGNGGLIERTPDGRLAPLPEAPANATAFFALPGRPGTWVALNNDRVHLYRRDGDTWKNEGAVPGLVRVRGLVADAAGAWWLGRPAGGVLRATFPDGPGAAPAVTAFAAPDGLPPGHGWTRFTADHRGPLLACNLGLLRFDPDAGRFKPTAEYGPELADGSTYVYGSAPDRREGLWTILRPAGEAEAGDELRLAYGRAGVLTPVRIPPLTLIDDPGHLLHEPAGAGRPETLWIAGHGALVRLDLDRWRAAPPPAAPALRISSLVTGSGARLALAGAWQLPFRDRSLRVLFAAPELAADPGATYESVLLSASGEEVRRDGTPERDFSALGAGRYELRLRARSPGGPWSPPAVLRFSVLPPWWLSPLAFAAYGLAGAGAAAAAWGWRTRQWRRRRRELEAAVAARTSELAAQNAELVRLRQIEFDEKLAARLAEHKARLEVLRYQLNPHFLFNTLTSICAQIIQAPRHARDTVIRLAEFCRLTLHRPGEHEEPTLGEEVEMLRAYLDIEQTRLGDLLEYTIESDPALDALRLPPFLLLPIVENAVKYGAATSRDRVRIRLAFRRGDDGRVLIEVANSGQWIAPGTAERSVPSLGIGLENLRQRLARYFPGRHEFTTEPADGWVVVRVRLDQPPLA